MKVKENFFCIQTKTSYKKGDEYKGKRKDLGSVLVADKKKKKE